MRIVIYIVILTTLFFVPLERVNVGDLEPVWALAIYADGNKIAVETDSGAIGSGSSVGEAVRDLKERTPAVIYLDTARYLFVAPGLQKAAQDFKTYLRVNINELSCDASGAVSEYAEYVSVHGKLPVIGGFKSKKK